jgi:flavorubredoxin
MRKVSPIKIVDGVHWVGALDPDLRIFDVIMETRWGTTYNSFLVEGTQKRALIEVVKDVFGAAHLETLRQVIDPKSIDYIVINHAEPDHSGALGDFLAQAVNATVVCSRAASTFLKEIVNADFPCRVVTDGDIIDLGDKSLQFISAPFLHWPDSMFTYLPEDRILFPGDVFGCHYCDERMFNDLVVTDLVPAQEYYFDVIMSPFASHMLEAIEKIRNLQIDAICPGHGPILRQAPWETVERVENWARGCLYHNDPQRIFVGYVSAYGNTGKIAQVMASAAKEAGLSVTMMDVSESEPADVIAHIDQSDAVLLGSPTINRDALKPVWDVLISMSALKNRGKLAGAFGSYGWSGEAVKMINDRLKSLGLKIVEPGFRTKLVPDAAALAEAAEYGRLFAKNVKEAAAKTRT